MTDLYLSVSAVSEVLSSRALAAVRNKDGRERDPVTIAVLAELAAIASCLALPDAGRFATLTAAAEKGHTKDLERACLAILGGR